MIIFQKQNKLGQSSKLTQPVHFLYKEVLGSAHVLACWATPLCFQPPPMRMFCLWNTYPSGRHGPFLHKREGSLGGCQGILLKHRQNKITFIHLLFNRTRDSWQQTRSFNYLRVVHENIHSGIFAKGTCWLPDTVTGGATGLPLSGVTGKARKLKHHVLELLCPVAQTWQRRCLLMAPLIRQNAAVLDPFWLNFVS